MLIAGRAERLPRIVWWLVLARAINKLGAFSLGFLTVLITTEFGVSAVAAGLISAAFGLATIPSRLLGGVLADRFGRRRTIVAGLVGCALAQAGIAASGSVAMIAVFACALVVRLTLPADRPFAPSTSSPAQPTVPGRSAWRDRSLLLLLASGTCFALIYMQVGMALPLALVHRGLPAADAGLLSTVSAVVMVLCQPLLRWTAALPHHAAMTCGYLLLAAGLAGYAVADGLSAHLAATVVWSAGDVLMFGRSYAMVVAIAPEDARGRYLSIFGTSWGFATVLAPVFGTQLLEHTGPAGLWGGLALVSLLLAVAQLTVIRPVLRRTARSDTSQRAAV